MSRIEFAKMCGVTRGAITNAVTRGKLLPDISGHIDAESKSAQLYIAEHKASGSIKTPKPKPKPVAKPKKETKPQPKPQPKPEPIQAPKQPLPSLDDLELSDLDDIDFDHPELYIKGYDSLPERDKAAQTLKRLVEIKRHQQMYREKAGQLIERELVQKSFAKFAASLQNQLLTLPRRVSAQTVARARADGERAVEEYLSDEISRVIRAVIQELSIG